MESPGGALEFGTHQPAMKMSACSRCEDPFVRSASISLCTCAHLYIFVLVIFIPVMPWFLRLRLTIAMRRLRGLVRSIRLHVFAATNLLRTPPPHANSLGWCAAHLRLSSGSSDGAPRIVGSRSFRMTGKSHLPTAERKATVNQKTDNEAPAHRKPSKRMPEKGLRNTCRSGCPGSRPSCIARGTPGCQESSPTQHKDKDGGHNKQSTSAAKSRTVAGSTEGRSRSCSSSSRREETIETTAAATSI